MATTWHKRTGQRTTAKAVRASKNAFAKAKRTGRMDNLRCSVQPEVADEIDAMSLRQFATWSGQYVYRTSQ